MTERGILFSAPMVRALLRELDPKLVTRRLPQKLHELPNGDHRRAVLKGGEWWIESTLGHAGVRVPGPWNSEQPKVGDRLWVRETWRTWKKLDNKKPNRIAEMCLDAGYRHPWSKIQYLADGHVENQDAYDDGDTMGKTRVSIHMPRWASRITLEVTDVRVERLREITEEDARAEGVEPDLWVDTDGRTRSSYRQGFRKLWDVLNAARAPWADNPWVWRIAFRRLP